MYMENKPRNIRVDNLGIDTTCVCIKRIDSVAFGYKAAVHFSLLAVYVPVETGRRGYRLSPCEARGSTAAAVKSVHFSKSNNALRPAFFLKRKCVFTLKPSILFKSCRVETGRRAGFQGFFRGCSPDQRD